MREVSVSHDLVEGLDRRVPRVGLPRRRLALRITAASCVAFQCEAHEFVDEIGVWQPGCGP